MDIVYRALDGKIFDSAAKCQDYEDLLGAKHFRMYDEKGCRVTDTDSAMVVWIDGQLDENGNEQYFARQFIELCQKNESPYDGIEEGSFGWFYWDEWHSQFAWATAEMLNAVSVAKAEKEIDDLRCAKAKGAIDETD